MQAPGQVGRVGRGLQAGGRQTLSQRVAAIFRRFGSDAHVYLPGIGRLSGFEAGNFIDSAGTQPGVVDSPVGLVVNANGALGVELVTNGANLVSTTGWTARRSATISTVGGSLRTTNASSIISGGADQAIAVQIGKTYRLNISITGVSPSNGTAFIRVGRKNMDAAGGADFEYSRGLAVLGNYTAVFTATVSTVFVFCQVENGTDGFYIDWNNISVREVPGIQATQATTSDKPILRQTGGRFNWVFDGTNRLTGTYPAGYESVTVIDSRITGQVTTTGVNAVGAYSMGPNATLYGRILIRGSVPAADLAVLQSFANRLAGL